MQKPDGRRTAAARNLPTVTCVPVLRRPRSLELHQLNASVLRFAFQRPVVADRLRLTKALSLQPTIGDAVRAYQRRP